VTLNNNEKQTVSNNLQGKPHEYSLDLFKRYIAHDDELKEALSLLLEPASKNKNSVINIKENGKISFIQNNIYLLCILIRLLREHVRKCKNCLHRLSKENLNKYMGRTT